jgi:hypothetical protein
MDDRAKKEAEALRYRLTVLLLLVSKEAESRGRSDMVALAATLRSELDAIDTADPAAAGRLDDYRARVTKLQQAVGLPDHGMRAYPRWLRFAGWTVPLFVGVGILAIVIERRRKKKAIDAAALQKLDEAKGESAEVSHDGVRS